MSWCRISAWNNGMLGSDSWAIATQILHITREGRCTSTHGANGLLLNTCITPHCLPTTHGAARPTSRVTPSQLCSNSKCTVHHVTTNDTKQCHNYSGLFGQKTCLWVDCDSFVPSERSPAEDDWRVSLPLKVDLYPTEPTHITAAVFVLREQQLLFSDMVTLSGEQWKR